MVVPMFLYHRQNLKKKQRKIIHKIIIPKVNENSQDLFDVFSESQVEKFPPDLVSFSFITKNTCFLGQMSGLPKPMMQKC